MKKLLLFTILCGYIAYPQASSKLNNGQNTISTGQPRVIVSADTLPSGLWRTYWKPSVTWNFSQIVSRPTTLAGYGITDAYPLSGNPSNFLTGITSSQVATALGYTPYNATNPNNYISGINSGMVTGALGYNPINPNGSANQYIAGDGTKINFPSIPAAQVNSDWNASSGVAQVLNKPLIPSDNSQLGNGAGYVNTTGARNAISVTTTGTGSASYNSSTGVINIPTPLVPASTTNLPEGTNLYFTIPRARTSISNGTGIGYDSSTGVITNTSPYIAPTFNNTATKTLNGAGVQISTTKNTKVSYTVTHTIALTLLVSTGSSMAYLEISPNNSTWTTVSQGGVSRSLAVAVSLNDLLVTNLQCDVPAGWYVRIRSVVSGGGTATYTCGQEVQY